MNTKANKCTIKQLYVNVGKVLSKDISIFNGLTLADISIDNTIKPNDKYSYSYYTGTAKNGNKDYKVNLKISNTVIHDFLSSNLETGDNAKYDIVIDSLNVANFGQITITVKSLKETGVSNRELLNRRLKKYVKDNGYDKLKKKELPKLVTSILAITSKHSEIHDDIHSNLNIPNDRVTIVKCTTSREISNYINSVNTNKYDIIVLYRGGREDEAMSLFSSEEIIDAIVKSKIPVCVALGHDMDRPFIYEVADLTYSTPSAFGKAIYSHNERARDELDKTLYSIKDSLLMARKNIDRKHDNILMQIESNSGLLYEKLVNKIQKLYDDSNNNIAILYNAKISNIDKLINNIELKTEAIKEKQ